MSELNNPLFENQREFLERQKEEYKNALMGDVDQIKTQGQEIGKKVAMAGGVLLAGYLLKRLFSGGDKKKTPKPKKVKPAPRKAKAAKKGKKSTSRHSVNPPIIASTDAYDSMAHKQEDGYTLSSERMHHADHSHGSNQALAKGFMQSDLAQVISQQVIALLMVFITKKVEEYINSVSKNTDIAATPIEVIEIETTEYIIPEEDAL